MRSVVVVLPASMCAMMPILRIFSSGTVRAILLIAISLKLRGPLPAVVREGLVRLRHTMHVVFLLDGAAAHIRGVVQLICQLFRHALIRPGTGVRNEPAQREAGAAALGHFDRHLIVGTADAAGLYLEQRLHVLDRFLK